MSFTNPNGEILPQPRTQSQLRSSLHTSEDNNIGLDTRVTDIEADYVSATSVFGTDEAIVIADGGGRGAKASSLTETDLTTLSTNAVRATTTWGSASLLVESTGDNRTLQATSIATADITTASSAFGVDNSIIRSNGASKGLQASLATIDDTGVLNLSNTGTGVSTSANALTIVDDQSNTVVECHISRLSLESTSFGVGAGMAITTGTRNTFFGYLAGMSVDTGIRNTFVGRGSGSACTSGGNNAGVGHSTLNALTTGSGNLAFGSSSLPVLVGGSNNMAIGSSTGAFLTTGTENIFIGAGAGASANITSATQNVFVGRLSGTDASQANTTGSICIGYDTYVTGNNALAIGYQVSASANQVVIGNANVTQTQLRGNILIEDTHDIVFDTSTGSAIASTASEKIAFWGATPIVQPAAANQAALTNSTGGTRDGTLASVGDTSASDQSGPINDNFTDLHELVDEIRTALVNAGLMKGSA